MATLRGSQQNDTLRGGNADDQIFGLGGDDRLFGGGGADAISGGAGNDRIDGGAGADQIVGGGGADLIFGGAGNDRIDGGDGADQIRGQAGADVLSGGRGDDLLFGNAGADQLNGGAGADHLNGGPGADRLFGGAGVDILTGGLGADQFVFSAAGQGRDRITDFDPAQGDHLSLTGALAGAAVRMVDDGTSTTVQVRTTAADGFSDLAVLEGHRAPIDVWYGDQQQFGDPGEAQRWINILGTAAPGGLESLTYSLNGGPEQTLSFGPFDPNAPADRNFTRLVGEGDFNIELDYRQLDPTATDDHVSIHATYADGEVFTHDVTIDYEDGNAWPTTYSIDWSHVTSLQDVVQVVDGRWSFDASGVRPAEQGYDRVLAIGDSSWDSYELRMSMEMHDLHTVDPRGRDGGAILIGLQWNGHTSSPVGGDLAPHLGWIPSGAFVFKGSFVNGGVTGVELRPTEWFPQFNGNQNPVVTQPLQLLEGHSYNFVVDSQRLASDTDPTDGIDRIYSLKVWEVGTPEPTGFLIQQTMVDQVAHGGIYLDAHYYDVTFGDLTVTPLPPSDDVLPGQDGLVALLGGGPTPNAAAGPASAAFEPAAMPPMNHLVASGDDPSVAA